MLLKKNIEVSRRGRLHTEQPRHFEKLVWVLASLNSKLAIKAVLLDLLTEQEIAMISSRLEAARLLALKTNYQEITKMTGLSSRTIARINSLVKNGHYGYYLALKKLGLHYDMVTRGGWRRR
jgi:uncharacterized protein YerC